jgi:toxin FitB
VSLVVLDTDVASASLRDRLPDRLRTALAGHTMCITFVTVGELMKWRVLRSWGPNRTADLARWRERVGVLEYDEAVAEKWGQLQARAQRRGRPRRTTTPGWPPAVWSMICRLPHSTPRTSLISPSMKV